MSLAIISNDSELFQELYSILTHYFKSPGQTQGNKQILVATKYYQCTVPVFHMSHHASNLDRDSPQHQKIDFIIFAFRKSEEVSDIRQLVDGLISKWEPESCIICVHDQQSDPPVEWKYSEDILNCNSLIPVVYENVSHAFKQMPEWQKGSLLAENTEEYEIFSILELIQTTMWTNSQNVEAKVPDPVSQQETKPSQQPLKPESEAQQGNVENESEGAQDEQKMERQMMQFELLMQEMMSLKHTTEPANSRKAKAEGLILRLAQNMEL